MNGCVCGCNLCFGGKGSLKKATLSLHFLHVGQQGDLEWGREEARIIFLMDMIGNPEVSKNPKNPGFFLRLSLSLDREVCVFLFQGW